MVETKNVAYVVKWNHAIGRSTITENVVVSLGEDRKVQIVDFEKGSEALRDGSIPGLAGKVARYFKRPHNGEPRYSVSLHPEGIIPEFVPYQAGGVGDVISFLHLNAQEQTQFVYCLQDMMKLRDELIAEYVKRANVSSFE